ncbi:trypsin-like peptidase domain-containing protein [Streptomyces neyagawaensis]|uniref:S1C family serine protease n=1 Tax=Streptomyces neyagawaensis TaxID=42238 RepID=UPI003F4D6BDF
MPTDAVRDGGDRAGDEGGGADDGARWSSDEGGRASDGGDFELERPATTPAPGRPTHDDDFELADPVTPSRQDEPPGDAASSAGSTRSADGTDADSGDFELERPVSAGPGPSPGGGADATTTPSVDTGGTAPAASGSAPVEADETTTRLVLEKSAPTTDETTPLPRHEAPATVVEAGVGEQGLSEPMGAPGPAEAPATAVERPKPLHDPDPYSTPPYGEPGPWAPAPPVQHPATTPAHGTTVQQGTQGTQGPGVPSPAAAPAPGTTAPAAPPEPGATTTMVAPRTAAPAPPPAHSANGTHTTSAAPSPAPASYGNAAPPPYADGQHSVAPPYSGGSQPTPPLAPHPYADGSQPPPPAHLDASRPSTPAAPYTDSSQPPFADAPQGASQAPRDPWGNYDPWSASGSLQQNGAGVDDRARRRKRGMKILVLGAVLIALVSGGVGGAVGAYLERNGGVGEVELPQAGGGTTGRAPDSVAGIAASALPSVVTLHVSGSDAQGTGTGFVLDKRGHILTNNHVVEPAGDDGEITVTFSGGETADASLVGRDSGYDLAVVKVSGVDGLKPLPLGNSDDVRVGDPVVAIGAPFDLANTVTSGIISAKERPITAGGDGGDRSDVSYVDALQTDAPINPGNSGGPLVDVNARVIGINSAIRSAGSSESDGGQAGSIGLGFAIPINQGKRVAEELINTGKATHPVIGVTLDMDYSGDGARVGDDSDGTVKEGGPADRAGIRAGDVITAVDGQRVHSGDELIVKVRAHRPGDRLELTVQRDGGEQKVTLTLGSSDGG